jgi:hypothetical protein
MGRDPVAVVEMLRTLWEFVGSLDDEEEREGGGGGEYACSLGEFLAVVSATIRTHGWLPKGKAWDEGRPEMATAPVAWDRIFERKVKEIPYLAAIQVEFVASAIVAYQRELSRREKAAQAAKSAAESEWMGEVKQRITTEVTVTMTRWIETQYGGSMLVKMRTDDGNLLCWFASNPPDCVEIGAHLSVTGTVKDHKEFAGAKETNLTRCKVTSL